MVGDEIKKEVPYAICLYEGWHDRGFPLERWLNDKSIFRRDEISRKVLGIHPKTQCHYFLIDWVF